MRMLIHSGRLYPVPDLPTGYIAVIPKRRAAARYHAARTSLPCREATVLHGSKYKAKIDSWCCRATICGPNMSGLSYFAIQIQSCFFYNSVQVQPQSKIFFKCKAKSKWCPENWKNAVFSQQKCRISFPL